MNYRPTLRLFLLVFMAILISRALAWTPFLNDYQPPPSNAHPNIVSALQLNDMLIVDTVTEFILYRVQNGHFSSIKGRGSPYSRLPMYYPSRNELPLQWTPLNRHGSLYAQQSRLPYLSSLARERLEAIGLGVRMLHIFDDERGVYVRWDVVDPTGLGVHRHPIEQNTNQWLLRIYEPMLRNYEGWGLNVCHDESDALCRLKRFVNDPIDFFRNY